MARLDVRSAINSLCVARDLTQSRVTQPSRPSVSVISIPKPPSPT